jgi:hypothetical protein
MPVITTSRLKKVFCQTLIREKLSNKIIFQNTTFLCFPRQLLLEEFHSYQCNSLSHTPFLFLIHGPLPSPKLPLLKRPSVIVLDNASYHNIKTEETVLPNFNQRKAVLQDYLSKHNIPFQPLETKNNFDISRSGVRTS